MIVSNDKFKTSNSEKGYKVHMKLTIKNVDKSDFGIIGDSIGCKSLQWLAIAHNGLIFGSFQARIGVLPKIVWALLKARSVFTVSIAILLKHCF